MSEEELEDAKEIERQQLLDKLLRIKKVSGGYAKSVGLINGDVIIGIDGQFFNGTVEEFLTFFDVDEEDLATENSSPVLTVKRDEVMFNLFCHQKIICKFEQIENPYSEPNEQVQQTLEMAKQSELSEYLIYHDNKKNAELLLRSKSLLAMIIPPFWFLNQKVPEAMLASVLGGAAAFAVHWILAALYYSILCLYVGREQLNMAMSFMSYKKMIYMQPIAAISELHAQKIALSIDNELYFQRPVEGLVQEKKRRKKKGPQKAIAA